MKRILITGKSSYIGQNVIRWLDKSPNEYRVDTISVRDESWKEVDFANYDVVLHLAGIAHVSTNPKMEEEYYRVNRDLTIELAKKAKADGVTQFIFMSSIIVYGNASRVKNPITKDTIPKPTNFYGNSKLQAEEGIEGLNDERFRIVIIRPPMIYGKGSKGNYAKLAKLARVTPIFPSIDNQRSMLYIDNLCEFLRLILDNKERGTFFPQNREYVRTSELVSMIAEVNNKKLRLTSFFNPVLRLLSLKIEFINKVFGNLVYEKNLSESEEKYQIRDLRESIIASEKNKEDKETIDILLMSDNSLETVGGEQESTKIIIKGIKDYYKVGVIQPGDVSNPVKGVEYYHVNSKKRIKHLVRNPFVFLSYIIRVRRLIIYKSPKMIHTQAQVSFFIVALLSKFKLIPKNIKLIHTERGLYTKYNSFFKRVFHFFMKELDVLVTTTKFNMNYWKEAMEQRNQFVEYKVIENTAGEIFESYDNQLENLKPDKSIVIGFAGRYCDWKNWPLAVEICKKLNDELGNKLHVKMAVGCLDDKAKHDTQNMFDNLKSILGERFQGLVNIDIEAMNKYYYELDVFILTSDYNTESFGRTLVEAMSRKTIVLTTNAGGAVEVVGNKKNVYNTVEGFSERILNLLAHPHIMDYEKEENLLRVKEKYSLINNIEKHLKLYNHYNN